MFVSDIGNLFIDRRDERNDATDRAMGVVIHLPNILDYTRGNDPEEILTEQINKLRERMVSKIDELLQLYKEEVIFQSVKKS